MTGPSTTCILIDKLNHHLQEIRLRALDSIISKLSFGFIHEEDYNIRKNIILKLLNWFSFDPCPQQEKVLDTIHTILKGKIGKRLIVNIGASKIVSTLNIIKGGGDALVCSAVKQIEEIVSKKLAERESIIDSVELESSNDYLEGGSQSTENERFPQESRKTTNHLSQEPRSAVVNCLYFMQLPWQPLVATDRHVLAAVEESLSSMSDPDLVLHTCNFFIDVMLQDFPAEVFLQRPGIVKVFISHLDGISPGSHRKACSAMLKCLHKLTTALLIRINFYSDPYMTNSKQEGCTSRSLTPSYLTHDSRGIEETNVYFSTEHIAPHRFGHSEDEYIKAGGDNNGFTNMRIHAQNSHSESQVNEKEMDGSNDVEDQVFLQFQQMSVPLFSMLALHQAVSHRSIHLTSELINLANVCVTPNIWSSDNSSVLEIANKAAGVLQLLGDAIKVHMRAPQTDEDTRLTYLQTLALTRRFLLCVVPLELADSVVPRNLKYALISSLLDYPLMCLLPELHHDILSHCKKFTGTQIVGKLQHYNDTMSIVSSMESTVNFLKNYDRLDGKKILDLVEQALPSLALHKANSFLKIIFEIYKNKLSRWSLDKESHKVVTRVTLSLLTHTDPEIKLQMYSFCHKLVTSTLGVVHNSCNQGPSQVSFLFHFNILTEIICHGVTSEDEKIAKYSTESLIHLLKGKIFMSSTLWEKFIEQLIPTMPLLECHATKSSNLGRDIVGMLEPKTSDSLCISKTEVMKGNLRLLFAIDEYVRNDAMSRLMALVVHEEGSSEKVPQITSLHFKTLITYHLFEGSTDISVPRCHSSFYEINSMCQVLELLKGDVTEPRIHRSALSQMAAMMEDSHLHASFLEQNGIDTCLQIFKRALIEKDYDFYPDSVISVVSILKSLCFQNSEVRGSLCQDYSLYCCILRALFMFGNNRNVRNDIGQLLCLLLYSDYILCIPAGNANTSVWNPLSFPELIVKCMNLPFLPRTHWHSSPHIQMSLKGSLLSKEDSHSFLRMCWTCEWFGGIKQMLSWHTVKLTEQSEFSPILRASVNDLNCLKCTAINHCSKQCLYSIQNATSHQSVEISVKRMLGYVTLQALLVERSDVEIQACWSAMPWESTLLRFFSTAPACSEDEDLLITLLQFLSVCFQHLTPIDIRKPQWTWVYRMLKDPSQPLPCLLKMDSSSISKNVCREILQLCQDCCRLEQDLEEEESGKNKADVVSWVYLIYIISQNLKFRDTQHFYNLAFLDWMLACLSRVTGSLGWSRGFDHPGELTSDLIWHLAEIIIAFHCNKAGQSGTNLASFMGLSVTRNAIVCMNHILYEMQNSCTNRSWEAAWFTALTGNELDGGVSLNWLPSLWISRDPIVRCSSLQLVAGLVSTQLGSRFLMQGLRDYPPNIWNVAMGFLLDQEEASVIREKGALIVTNLSNHSIPSITTSSGCVDSNPEIEAPQVLDAFVSLLEEKHFFSGVVAMFSGLCFESRVKVGSWPSSNAWSADSASATSQDTDLPHLTASQDDEASCTLATPNLIKAVCWFMNNLLTIIPEEIVEYINKFGLIRIFFQSISMVPPYVKTKLNVLHYIEVLEMYVGVCMVLSKCVSLDSECLTKALTLNNCLEHLMALLNPELYCVQQGVLVHLRNRLWSQIYRLLSCLLAEAAGYVVILNSIMHCSPTAFLSCLEIAINGRSSTELRSNALSALTLLLSQEIKTKTSMNSKSSLQHKSNTLEILSFQNILDWKFTTNSDSKSVSTAGEKLGRLLMRLYEILSLRHCSGDKVPSYFPKASVISALSSLLSVSNEAKKYALKEGLLESVMVQLREFHVHISVEAIDSRMWKLNDKKRVSPVFQEVNWMFGLLTNFMYKAPEVKSAAVGVGLADIVHKLWAWCCVIPCLLEDTLKMLCTFTTKCIPACHSLVLTTPIVGVTVRKVPTSNSLLHEVVNLIIREIELLTKGGDLDVLELAFHLLQNATHSQECRVILFKTTLFQNLLKQYPSFTKKPKHWEMVESMWLPFFLDCTAHSEGQLGLPKVGEALDMIINLVEHSKQFTRQIALAILRNITFHNLNRPRLLSSASYLQLLNNRLCEKNEDEVNMVIQMVWALVANNQKAKLIIKSSGIANLLQDIGSCVKVTDEQNVSKIHHQMLDNVLGIIFSDRHYLSD